MQEILVAERSPTPTVVIDPLVETEECERIPAKLRDGTRIAQCARISLIPIGFAHCAMQDIVEEDVRSLIFFAMLVPALVPTLRLVGLLLGPCLSCPHPTKQMSGITQHHVALLRRHASNLLVASLVLGQHTGAQASCCALPRQWRDTDHASVLRLCEIRENHLITRHSLVLWTKEDQPAPSTVHSLPLARWGELQLHLERCDKVARSSSRGLLDGNPSKFDRVFEIEDDGLRRRVALRYPSRV
mmetsp:Transcript_40645/g.111821  ORF Transcript_40645/g.111821 Transcript_40645/m.111821 type:complete len:244 (-) Transcript_40645:1566-2297(-)